MRPGDVKAAILLALMDMLEPIVIFFFQLQPTFVNLTDDPSSMVACTRVAKALGSTSHAWTRDHSRATRAARLPHYLS